jgi:hypothetical protein
VGGASSGADIVGAVAVELEVAVWLGAEPDPVDTPAPLVAVGDADVIGLGPADPVLADGPPAGELVPFVAFVPAWWCAAV